MRADPRRRRTTCSSNEAHTERKSAVARTLPFASSPCESPGNSPTIVPRAPEPIRNATPAAPWSVPREPFSAARRPNSVQTSVSRRQRPPLLVPWRPPDQALGARIEEPVNRFGEPETGERTSLPGPRPEAGAPEQSLRLSWAERSLVHGKACRHPGADLLARRASPHDAGSLSAGMIPVSRQRCQPSFQGFRRSSNRRRGARRSGPLLSATERQPGRQASRRSCRRFDPESKG